MVNACVRIDDREGQPLGTGFLIGPSFVATAAHNLWPGVPSGHAGATNVVSIPAKSFRVYEPQSGTTFACSSARYQQSRDIAVIELRKPVEVPVPPLVTEVTATRLRLFSTVACVIGFDGAGHSRRMRKVKFHGTPTDDPRDKVVTNGQIVGGLPRGMSGSPLLLETPGSGGVAPPVMGLIQLGGEGAYASSFLGSDGIVRFLRDQGVRPQTIRASQLLPRAVKVRIKRLIMMGFILAAALPEGIAAVTECLEKLSEDE